jgi:type 1 glutamine amidotransferase
MHKKIYSVLGDYYHEHDLLLDALNKAIRPLLSYIELFDIIADDLPEIITQKPNLIILNKENRVNPAEQEKQYWMTRSIEKQIFDYVVNGGSFIAWHAGLASYPVEGQFYSMLKGYFKSHPNDHIMVKYIFTEGMLVTDKPVNFEVLDEHYFVECNSSDTNVFLVSQSVEGSSVAGWAHKFGNGRVCCITPSHMKEGLLHMGMLNLLQQCIQWCCKT